MTIKEIANGKPVMKIHGCGNDFVLLPDYGDKLECEQVKKICARHFGVGSDGLVVLMESRVPEAKYRMKFYNPDGTTAEMCGNAIRCFAKYLVDLELAVAGEEIPVDTDAGIVKPVIEKNTPQRARVRVNMGIPVFNSGQVAVDPGENGLVRGETCGMAFTFVSMGNPHAVFFCDNPPERLKKYGKIIESDTALFPWKTNVEFVRVNSENDLSMHVRERNAGETLACGTGACASMVAAVVNGCIKNNAVVHLPGGDLEIAWEGKGEPVFMTGEACNVFEIKAETLDSFLFGDCPEEL